jgi:hypothetical protein
MSLRHIDDPVQLAIYGLLIITGLIDCFFGYRAFRYALGLLLGFVGLGVGAYFAYQYGDSSWTMALIGAAIGGILGVILSAAFFKGALVATGAMMGYAILAPLIGDLEPWLQLVVLVIGCGIFGLVAIGVATIGIMAATAITGSFRIIYGGWYLVGGPSVLSVAQEESGGWHLLASSQEPFIAMVLLAAVGFAVQFYGERKHSASAKEKD